MRSQVAAVSCPSCGVGLRALGGGRVVLQVCSHCGAALDVVENYRLLKTFSQLKRPDTPFGIGMEGQIQGVGWTIIGILAWTETWRARTTTWVDHQLYSATHGYAWLTLEDGHLIMTRAWRGALTPAWITPLAIELADNRPHILARGTRFDYYETTTARIAFAEGEFSWACLVGQTVQSTSFLSEDAMLVLSGDAHAREVEIATFPDQEATWAAFGLRPAIAPRRTHPLQPFRAWRHESFLSRLGLATSALALVLALGLMGRSQAVTPVVDAGARRLPIEATLPITQTTGLVTLEVESRVTDGWASIDLEITDPEGRPLLDLEREVSHYQGVEEGEFWIEDNRRLSVSFRPTVAGPYSLALTATEGGKLEGNEGPPAFDLYLRAWEGVAVSAWMWLAAAVALAFGLLPLLRRSLHRKARWHGSDWTEED